MKIKLVTKKTIMNLRQLRMNQVTKTTVVKSTAHYDYELLELVLKNNGAY